MHENSQKLLSDILDRLRKLDDARFDGYNISTSHLSVIREEQDECICISGNQEGLVRLARVLLEIAQKGCEGAQQKFDEFNELYDCDIPLVVKFEDE